MTSLAVDGPVLSPRLLSRGTWLSLAAAGLTVVVFLAVPELRGGQDVPLLAALGLLFGSPHGAVDHLLPQSNGWPVRGKALLGVLFLYIATVVVMLALILISPVIGIAAVIVFSVVHLGSADAALAQERRGRPPRYGLVAVLAYGGPIPVISFVRWPGQVRDIFAVISPNIAEALRVPMLIAAGVTMVAVAIFIAATVRQGEWLDAAEVLLLLLFALAVPPLAAFGIYFGAWHSLRGYVRLYADARGTPGAGRHSRPGTLTVKNLFTTMAVATMATVTLCVTFVAVLRIDVGFVGRFHLGDWLIVLLAAIVAPHVITYLRYDRWKVAHSTATSAPIRSGARTW